MQNHDLKNFSISFWIRYKSILCCQ